MTNSISLFPTEDKQTLRADKLNISFCFASYSSSLTIRDNNKELTIYLDEKVVMDHVLNSVTNLNVSYASNRDYMIELFKKSSSSGKFRGKLISFSSEESVVVSEDVVSPSTFRLSGLGGDGLLFSWSIVLLLN